MDEPSKSPRQKTLLDRLEEKHQMPITIIKYTCCASCVKSFTRLRQPSAELHSAADDLRQPILYLCLLCQTCADKYRSGGRGEKVVLAAVEEFLAKEGA